MYNNLKLDQANGPHFTKVSKQLASIDREQNPNLSSKASVAISPTNNPFVPNSSLPSPQLNALYNRLQNQAISTSKFTNPVSPKQRNVKRYTANPKNTTQFFSSGSPQKMPQNSNNDIENL